MGDGRRSWLVGLRAAVYVGSARLLLTRRKPSVVLQRLAGGPSSGAHKRLASNQPVPDPSDTDAAMVAVRRAGRVARAGCLPQAIALAALLQRSGAEPALILGCRRYGANDWGAHAWVEVDGQVLDPVEQPHHAQLARLVAAQNWQVGPASR